MEGIPLGEYAVKKVAVGNDRSWLTRMLREVRLLERSARHANIIEYKHAWIETTRLSKFAPEVPHLFILMELASEGNLARYMREHSMDSADEANGDAFRRRRQSAPLPSQPVSSLLRQLMFDEIGHLFLDACRGLHHLHAHDILHRDLKPENLLASVDLATGAVKLMLADFGECGSNGDASQSGDRKAGTAGTIEYMAPEIIRASCDVAECTRESDVYSLGMVLYFMTYRGQLPFSQLEDTVLLHDEILNSPRWVVLLHVSDDVYVYSRRTIWRVPKWADQCLTPPPSVKHLLATLLSYDPKFRLTTQEILEAFESFEFHRTSPASVSMGRRRKRTLSIEYSDSPPPRGLIEDAPESVPITLSNDVDYTVRSVDVVVTLRHRFASERWRVYRVYSHL